VIARLLATLVLALALLPAPLALAQSGPPDNDDRASDTWLSDGEFLSATNAGATKEPGEADHAGDPGGHSVWIHVYAETAAPIVIDACGSDFDTVLAVYTSSYGGDQEVVSDTDSAGCGPNGKGSVVRFTPTADTVYDVALDGHAGATGTYLLRAMSNDDRAGALWLYPGAGWTTQYTNRFATAEASESAHAGSRAAHSVWFRVQPDEYDGPMPGQEVEVNTCATTVGGLDTVLAAYTSTGSELVSSDDAVGCGPGGHGSLVRFTMPDAEVLIAVDGKAGAVGDFSLELLAAPPNDDRANARPLWTGGDTSYWTDTTLATRETGEPQHAGDPGGHSIWFTVGPGTSGHIALDLCESDFDTLLAVYTEGTGGLEEVTADDDTPGCGDGTGSSVAFDASSASTYYVAVDGKAGAAGVARLHVAAPLPNDAFARPDFLSSYTYGTTANATAEAGEPAHAGTPAAHSVWYQVQASSTSPMTVSTCSDSTAPTRIAVYDGSSLATLQEVASSGPVAGCGSGRGSSVRWTPTLPSGTSTHTYFVAVDAAGADTGSFTLTLGRAPDNDARSTASMLYDGYTTSGSTAGAGLEPGEPDHAQAGTSASVWYRWTPSRSTRAGLNTCRFTTTDTVLAVYRETSTGLDEVAANDDTAGCGNGHQSRVSFDASSTTTYYIAVATREGQEGYFVLDARLRPANDDQAAAQTIAGDAYAYLDLATEEAGEPEHGGEGGGHSVWYRWVAPHTGPTSFDTCDQSIPNDTLLAVYTGGYGGLQEVASSDDAPACGPSGKGSRLTFAATAGTEYLIALDARLGPNGYDYASLHVPPGNDFFDAAYAIYPSGSSYYADLTRATAEPGEPAHGGVPAARSLWYSWTPSRDALATVDTCQSTNSRVAAYTGASVDALTPVTARPGSACPAGQTGARLRFEATAGTTYRIAIDGAGGSVSLSARLGPDNDALARSRSLSSVEDTQFGTTADGGREDGEPDHAGAHGTSSVWYRFTPAWSGTANFDTCDSGYDTALAAYAVAGTGIAGLDPVAASNADDCDSGDRLRFHVQAGQAYALAVDGADGATGSFVLDYRLGPINDDLANAAYISEGTATGDTSDAGRETGERDHGGAGGDASLWYRWQAPYDGAVRIDTCATTDFDTALDVARQTGTGQTGLLTVAQADDSTGCGAGGKGARVRFDAVAGVSYFIAVDGQDGARGEAELTVEQAPPNDRRANAEDLGDGSNVAFGDTIEATHDAAEPDHGGRGGTASVWYRWTPGHAGAATVGTCAAADFESVVAVYTPDLTPVATGATDDASCAGGRGSRAAFRAEADTAYLIAVDGDAGAAGAFQLDAILAPVNDDIANASALQPRVPAELDTRGATREAAEPVHGGPGGASVWYRFTAPRTGNLTLTTCGSDFDTLLAVYSGTPGSLTQLAADDDGGDCAAGTSRASFSATAGTEYYVAVDGRDGATGTLALTLDPPANDRFQDAEALSGRPASVAGSTFGATTQSGEPGPGGNEPVRTVWWRWTAPTTRVVTISTCGSNVFAHPAVYTGDTLDALSPAGEDGGPCVNGERTTLAAEAGTTYRIQVDTPIAGGIQLHIDAPANDDFASATRITLGDDDTATVTGSIAGAGREPGELALSTQAVGRTVWYAWTAVSGAPVEIDTCDAATPTIVRPFRGRFVPVALRDDAEPCPDGSNGERVSFDGVPGVTYEFAVDGVAPAARAFTLRVAQQADVTPPVSHFTLAPAAYTNAETVSFSFVADEQATFECSLDGAAEEACSSPVSVDGLDEGRHRFAVRATDRRGNVEADPAVATFTIDRTPPDTTISDGPTEPVHDAVSFTFHSTETGSRFECTVDGEPLACRFTPADLAPGTHELGVAAIDRAGNVDATPATTTFEIADAAPTLALAATPDSGAAPLDVSLALGAGDADEDLLRYEVDWGDGSALKTGTVSSDAPLTHRYGRAGVYTISTRVRDPWLETVATHTIEVSPGEPLDARAGEDRVVETGQEVRFDGGDSRPLAGIERYHWDFGDGTLADGAAPVHTYAAAGTYTARLTVTMDGESRSDEATIRVDPPAPGGLNVTAFSGGSPLPATDVVLIDADGRRYSGLTDAHGAVRLRGIPDGEFTLYADKQGFTPATVAATVAGGTGSVTVDLHPGEVVAADLSSRPLSYDEIVARGIDPDDPQNQHVFEFSVDLVIDGRSTPIRGAISDGGFWGTTIGGGGSCTHTSCVTPEGYVVTSRVVDGHPMITTLVLPFKASWLKEFFDVSMVVTNLAPPGFTLAAGRTSLYLPSGLRLAPTAVPQHPTVAVPDIPGGQSRTVHWTVRGDTEGAYDLKATYTGRLDPNGRAVTIEAQTAKPLKVWGGSAVELTVETDDVAGRDHPFTVRVGMKNVADVPVYNPAVEMKPDGLEGAILQPRQQLRFATGSIKPGATNWAGPYILVPDGPGRVDVSKSFVRKLAGDVSPVTKVTTRTRTPSLEDDPKFEATPGADRIELDWDPVAGASGYELYRTSTEAGSPFSDAPIARTASSKATITVPHADPAQRYAVSAIVDGRPTLRHPVITAAAGTEDPPATTEDPNGAPDPTCAAGPDTKSELKVGPVNLHTGCFHQIKPGVWESEAGAFGRVRAAGVDLTPTGSATVRVDIPNLTVSIAGATVSVGDWVLYQGKFEQSFAKPISIAVPKNATFKGLPVTGSVTLTFGADHATLTANAGLPSKFGGVTGELKLGASLNEGLILGEVKIAVPEAPIGKLGLKDLSLGYSRVSGKDRWEGGAGLMLPAKGFAESVSGKLAFLGGSFESASAEVEGLNRPLGSSGIFLQRVRVRVVVQPRVTVGGGLGVSAGPRVAGHEALSVDGDVDITFADPITYAMKGTLKVVDAQIASGHFDYRLPSDVDFGGELDLSKEILGSTLGVQASMEGWMVGTQAFNVQGSGTVSGPGWSNGGEAVLSDIGVAACRRGSGPDVGAGYHWDGDAKWFASSCSISDFVASRPSLKVRRMRGRTVESRLLSVPAGTPVAVFAVTGESAPPKITLTGPQSETVTTPAGPEAAATERFFLMQSPGDRTTYVAVDRPSAGEWDLRSDAASSPVADVRQAASLPPTDVDAEVTGKAGDRDLTWSLAPAPGMEVEFVAEGNGTRQVIATTADAAGTVAFTPEAGPSGRRVVRAYVTQDGLPRESFEVAAFDVDDMIGARTGLALERTTADPTVVAGTWDAVDGANGYRATLDVSDGRRVIVEKAVGDRAITIGDVPDGATVTLEVAVRTPSGAIGPSAITRLGGPGGSDPAVTIAHVDAVHTGEPAALSAAVTAGSDPVQTIAWELDGDGDFDDAKGVTTSKRFDSPGVHVVEVRVTDKAGRVALARQQVDVLGDAPTASVALDGRAPVAGESSSFTGTDSDADGVVLSRRWDLDDDGEFDDADSSTASTSFGAAGPHTVRYRVTDDSGQSFTAERVVDVAANRPPELTVTVRPDSPVAGDAVSLSAGASDPDGRPLEAVTWDLDGDGRFGDAAGTDVAWTFPAPADVPVRARVADSGGLVTTVERTITVRPVPGPPPPGPGPGVTPTPTPSGGGGGPAAPSAKPFGGVRTAKVVRRKALLRWGLKLTFTGVLSGARLDVRLRFIPRHGHATTLGRLKTVAKQSGRLTAKLRLSKAGRRRLHARKRGRLVLLVSARAGSDPPLTLTRKLKYRP
jgi:PKD repeat protein